MAYLWCDKSDACGIVATGFERVLIQKRKENNIYFDTDDIPYYYDVNSNGAQLKKFYKVRELGVKYFVTFPTFFFFLDYP